MGGMGRVYRAEQTRLGRTVAVKVIHPHLLGDDQTVARFYNEARAASRLNNPDSVSIIDFGRTEDGILYLVMEHLSGRDLGQVMVEDGPLPFPRICRIVRHVLSALDEAHALNVIHRDLKPENVIIGSGHNGHEVVKVVDFGLATITGPGSSAITRPGVVCGTPDYMSPEQGRGEALDGRSDVYAIGVVLFEMLTDRLPFIDETPSKVILRHLSDPVPDPRAIAPHRGIPNALAQLAMRALTKRRDERFQSAGEMGEAVQRIEQELDDRQAVGLCPHCGATNPRDVKFCSSCGVRFTAPMSLPPSSSQASIPPAHVSLPPVYLPGALCVGRDREFARLDELRQAALQSLQWVILAGEAGVGKTRILSELVDRSKKAGDLVVASGPHISSAPVAYAPIRHALATLFDVEEDRLDEVAQSSLIEEPLLRAGLEELLEPKGLTGLPGHSRAAASAYTLALGVRVALARIGAKRAVLIIDDIERCDGLSWQVLDALYEHFADLPLMLVCAARSGWVSSSDVRVMTVAGLGAADARQIYDGAVGSSGDGDASHVLPLYAEQLKSLGLRADDGDCPTRLADVLSLRLDRLAGTARKVLQALAVAGNATDLETLTALCPDFHAPTLGLLERFGLVSVVGQQVSMVHPFIRETAEASIPAEARRELHREALELASAKGAPLEVRAEHAVGAGEPISALILLEQVGDLAIRRASPSDAVTAFRRGLELARGQLLVSGEGSWQRAVVTFSRKLSEAMRLTGDYIGADGVVREAIDLIGPASDDHVPMLLALARVTLDRGRAREAQRLLGQVVEAAQERSLSSLEGQAHRVSGEARRRQGDLKGAVDALNKAVDLLCEKAELQLDAQLALVDTLLEAQEYDLAAAAANGLADRAAAAAHLPLAVRAHVLTARLYGATKRHNEALRLLDEALSQAEGIGDVEGVVLCERQRAVLDSGV